MILPEEIRELHAYGITRIYSPDDGREMSLQGMINDLLEKSDFPVGDVQHLSIEKIIQKDVKSIANLISLAENDPGQALPILEQLAAIGGNKSTPVLGITGTGGSGKSSLVDELVRRYLSDLPDKTLAIISVDPTKRKTGGALLGDRIRMNAINNPRVFMLSLIHI